MTVGQKYSFSVANAEEAVELAISLNTTMDDIEPMDQVNAKNGDRHKITYLHVAGFVCNTADCG